MACGAVPVATDVGADGEVVAGCGTILDPGRLEAELGPAIAGLVADDAELARLKGRSRRRVVSRYGFRQNVERLLGVYDAARRGPWRMAR
jgi:glycosyltransferase involved in cell wall biosynthesis